MATLSEMRADTAAAIPVLRDALSILATRPPTDLNVITVRRLLALDLCATGAVAEGDSTIRATVAHVPLDATRTLPYRVRGVLFCLTRAGRFADAEPLLLEAEARLGALPAATAYRDLMVGWLVGLYDAWGNDAQAAAWKERRELTGRARKKEPPGLPPAPAPRILRPCNR